MSQTEALTLWGAVTGIIGTFVGVLGLWLRLRQHGLDKPKLKCESSFGYDGPKSPKHKITVRAVGRRPVSIDRVKYFITPRSWKQRVTKYWQHKAGRWLWDKQPQPKVKLHEGERADFRISLPDGLCITEIYKVHVVDQTGRSWPVNWCRKKNSRKLRLRKCWMNIPPKRMIDELLVSLDIALVKNFIWRKNSIINQDAQE